MDEYIRISKMMSRSSLIRNWMRRENNPTFRRQAFLEIRNLRQHMHNKPGLFHAIASSRNYYFNGKFTVRMNPKTLTDKWFFEMQREKKHFKLDIDYDPHAAKTRFWLNIGILEHGRFLGATGCGMDISLYIKTLLATERKDAVVILFDEHGTIKAHKKDYYIKRRTIYDLLDKKDALRLKRIITSGSAQKGITQIALSYLYSRRMASLGYISNVRWYALVLLQPDSVISFASFTPIFMLQLIGFAVSLLITYLFVNSLVLTPLIELDNSMKTITASRLKQRLYTSSRFELERLTDTFNSMLDRLETQQNELIAKERLEKEFEIVQKMQSSILPAIPKQKGYDVSARMIPAEEVGGDYYDYYRTANGNIWYGIGDVTGHGITSGIIMLMAQTAVNTILQMQPDITPYDLAIFVNRALYENIHNRLHSHSYMTFYFLQSQSEGVFRYAGSHSDILIYRAASGKCERIAPDGTWLGVFSDISNEIVQREFKLEHGDILILYTDGIIEAVDKNNEQFSIERLTGLIEQNSTLHVEELRSFIFEEVKKHMFNQDDDLTLFLIRRE